MGATTELVIPYPELPDVADGPDLAKDMADRIEATRTIVRLQERIGTYPPAGGIPINATKSLWEKTVSAACVGWWDLWFTVPAMKMTDDAGAINCDGNLLIYANGALVGQSYYHTQNRATIIPVTAIARINVPRATASVELKVWMSNGPGSNAAVQPGYLNGLISQMGAVR